jgi:NADPH:quinone reductase-like Zn-dependent oxidoreductase
MSSYPSNKAAWLVADKVTTLEVKDAPYRVPEPSEIVIQARAVAINPVDFAIQTVGTSLFPGLTFPRTLGMDLAGTIVEVSSAVTRFNPGDRVLTHPEVMRRLLQEHSKCLSLLKTTWRLINTSLEEPCVLPACLSVAACGLFQKDYLGLEYPTVPPTSNGKMFLVWGGSTSVGCNAIQLGVAAGYEVVTTCSPHNFEYVKKLGARYAFGYNSPAAVEYILVVLKVKLCAGAVAIGNIFLRGMGRRRRKRVLTSSRRAREQVRDFGNGV